ncbi:S8 family peptidase [Nitratireductor sp. GISD-1A_MAKvit]|uniref:S8 family peptidase n=1 Tax=Nitratireductor sp. GISD-1A_MAKvit TaxID=3234198 RepID=UPI003467C273
MAQSLPSHPPSGPSDPATGSGYPTLDARSAERYRQGTEFNHADPSDVEENQYRRSLGHKPICSNSINPHCGGASSYALQNIHHAHTAKLDDGTPLRGQGQTIAVFDNGFQLTHQELAGKEIIRYTAPGKALGRENHGTAVAAVAAGPIDGKGMVGVAPSARLHLASWKNAADGDALGHMADAALDARAHGAVVQNNSWGWANLKRADEEARDFAASGLREYARYLPRRLGNAPGDWRDLFAAYDSFQKTGVIVFSNTNQHSLGDVAAWAALPNFVPELSEAWITVSNAFFSIDKRNGKVLDADIVSAPCGSAARYCLVADGTIRVPRDQSDTAYGLGTGASFAAPQISGQIALLAQAFPELSPAEWTARLLASAQRGWKGFNDTISGYSEFAPGVRRAYSRLFGHGVPDMKAALQPIGGLSIATGENVFDGPRTPVSKAATNAPPIIGNAVAKALSGKRVMAIDALGSDFYVDGSEIVSRSRVHRSPGTRFAQQLMAEQERLGFAFAFSEVPTSRLQRLHSTASAKLFFSHGFAETQDGVVFSRLMPAGENRYLQFAGGMTEKTGGGGAMQFALSQLSHHEGFATELTLSGGHGRGELFGMSTESPFSMADSNGRFAASATLTAPLAFGWSLSGFGELGVAYAREAPGALVSYGALSYASGGLVLDKGGLFAAGDSARLYAGMKPNPLSGKTRVRLPVGRDKAGDIHYETVAVDLSEGDIPVRLGLSYTHRTEADFNLKLSANADFFIASPETATGDFAISVSKKF